MTAPNMGTITASIERSLRNCSLNHHQSSNDSAAVRFSTSDSTENLHPPNNTLELNSEIRLPYYWEQCLDLKTGEVYYINWRTGMKSQVDPRTTNPDMNVINGALLSSEDDDDGDDDSSYDSEGSSTEESSPSTSRGQCRQYNSPESNIDNKPQPPAPAQILVVAGCKSCFMYFMLPKQVEDCPKCFGQLLHFDPSENASP